MLQAGTLKYKCSGRRPVPICGQVPACQGRSVAGVPGQGNAGATVVPQLLGCCLVPFGGRVTPEMVANGQGCQSCCTCGGTGSHSPAGGPEARVVPRPFLRRTVICHRSGRSRSRGFRAARFGEAVRHRGWQSASPVNVANPPICLAVLAPLLAQDPTDIQARIAYTRRPNARDHCGHSELAGRGSGSCAPCFRVLCPPLVKNRFVRPLGVQIGVMPHGENATRIQCPDPVLFPQPRAPAQDAEPERPHFPSHADRTGRRPGHHGQVCG